MNHVFPTTHSADVEMWLDCGDHGVVELSRVTPRAVFAKVATEIPPCVAFLNVVVDHNLLRVRVNLKNGIPKGRRAARARAVDNAPAS